METRESIRKRQDQGLRKINDSKKRMDFKIKVWLLYENIWYINVRYYRRVRDFMKGGWDDVKVVLITALSNISYFAILFKKCPKSITSISYHPFLPRPLLRLPGTPPEGPVPAPSGVLMFGDALGKSTPRNKIWGSHQIWKSSNPFMIFYKLTADSEKEIMVLVI